MWLLWQKGSEDKEAASETEGLAVFLLKDDAFGNYKNMSRRKNFGQDTENEEYGTVPFSKI